MMEHETDINNITINVMSQQVTCHDKIKITSNKAIIRQNQHKNDKDNNKESRNCSCKTGFSNMIALI